VLRARLTTHLLDCSCPQTTKKNADRLARFHIRVGDHVPYNSNSETPVNPSSTSSASYGEGNIYFLDRQNVACTDSSEVLTYFKLQDANPNVYYNMRCQRVYSSNPTTTVLNTPAGEIGSNSNGDIM